MNSLQRSGVSFRRQGSSGRVWNDLDIESKSGRLAGFGGPLFGSSCNPTTGRSQELNPRNTYRFSNGGEESMHEKEIGYSGSSKFSHKSRNEDKRCGIFSFFKKCIVPQPGA